MQNKNKKKTTHLSENEDGLARELLLELLNKTALLDELLVDGELGDGDEDKDGLLALTNLDLLGGSEDNLLEGLLQLLVVDLELVDGLSNRLLKLVRLGLLDLGSRSQHGVKGPKPD